MAEQCVVFLGNKRIVCECTCENARHHALRTPPGYTSLEAYRRIHVGT